MYDELVKRLRKLAGEQMFDFERQPYLQAADAIEELSDQLNDFLKIFFALRENHLYKFADGELIEVSLYFIEKSTNGITETGG